MTATVALIGAGELGSRHLQAIRRLRTDAVIFALDPNPAALEIAKNRAAEIEGGRDNPIAYIEHIDDLPPTLDAAIVATTSTHRLDVMRQLLAARQVTFMILEKFLFQTISEYDEAQDLLDQHAISAWVNCPRRMMEFFKGLGALFAGSGPFHYKAAGSGWRLATNAIHHIDTIAMYAGTDTYTVDTSGLDSGYIPAQRQGFMEITGCLKGCFEDGSTFELTCSPGPGTLLETSIENEAWQVTMASNSTHARQKNKRTSELQEIEYQLPMQSELTNLAIESLLNTGTCELPTFAASSSLHRSLVTALIAHYGEVKNTELNRIPIT